MKLGGVHYKNIGKIPMNFIEDILSVIEEKDWYVDDYRKSAGNMNDCNSIPIFHSALCATDHSINTIKTIEKRKLYAKYGFYIEPFIRELKKHYSFNLYACFLSRLKPKGIIGEHRDSGLFLELCHRVHIPLKSNDKVRYVIDNTSYFWEPGYAYEFDNTLPHGVNNESSQDRIHLVVNLYDLTEEEINTGVLSEKSQNILKTGCS